MSNAEIIGQWRRMINNQSLKLIEVQKAVIGCDDNTFDLIQSVIQENHVLWDQLWEMEHGKLGELDE